MWPIFTKLNPREIATRIRAGSRLFYRAVDERHHAVRAECAQCAKSAHCPDLGPSLTLLPPSQFTIAQGLRMLPTISKSII